MRHDPGPAQPLVHDLSLPCDQPFTRAMAHDRGADDRLLRELVASRRLAHPMRNVYHPARLADTLELRVACLRLVVPPDAVVTDRTAAWLHGAPRVLAPNDHLATPPVSVFCAPGRRLRNGLVASGERSLPPIDVVDLQGVRVTTPLRTACDLGRLLHRDQALAALDSLARLDAFSQAQLLSATARFRGYRGVRQLRVLAPLTDPRAESPAESILRLRWLDAALPAPEPQHVVDAPYDGHYRLDLALPRCRFAAEYDGEEFHGPDQASYDERRRRWLREAGWVVVVVRRSHLFGHDQHAEAMLRQGYARATAGSRAA